MVKVKFKIFRVIFIILIVILFAIATFFLIRGLTYKEEKKVEDDQTPVSMPSVNIEEIIEKIKKEHTILLYESTNIPEFTSLVFLEQGRIQSYLIDKTTGKELTIEDIIKEDKKDDFLAKEQELLALKYPEFIVSGVNTQNGTKAYYVKENEMIIYYYDYPYEYDYTEEVYLTINYNEIADYLQFTPVLDEEYSNEDGYRYDQNKKSVAITFDDGPSSKYNSQFLEVLAKNKAHATFFMVGSMMSSCGKCVLDTYQSGNEIGSHTYSHINIKKSSVAEVNENLAKVDDLFYQITGDHIRYVRPPYGAYSKENLENINSPLILWNLDTEDWRYRDVDHIVNYVMENVSDGSIILMHELYETSLEALKIILPRLYAMGYQVVSVGELAELKGRSIEVGHAYRSFMS